MVLSLASVYLRSYTSSLLIAGISCVVRPTSAVLWLFLAVSVAWQSRNSTLRFFREAIMPS